MDKYHVEYNENNTTNNFFKNKRIQTNGVRNVDSRSNIYRKKTIQGRVSDGKSNIDPKFAAEKRIQ